MSDPFPELNAQPWDAGTRVALGISYHGSGFAGWQAQPQLAVETVQENLETALGCVAAETVTTVCAGRTDAGVHGIGQVVHFDAPCARSEKSWVMGGNRNLPDGIRVNWARQVPEDFHARFSALSRRYRYIIANRSVLPPHLAGLVSQQRRPLDVDLMHRASQCLLGEQDFSAFRAAQCQARHAVREITGVRVTRSDDLVLVDIEANAFLYHMVRNIAGALQLVGAGLRPVTWIEELLGTGDRTQGADTANASGLYLMAVSYPERFQLPVARDSHAFFQALG